MTAEAPAVRMIPVHDLIPTPDNPRFIRHDDAHASLVASIRSSGVLQPLLARPHPSAKKRGKLDLRAGSRRLAAAIEAGLTEVPVIVRDMDDREALEVTVTENLQREDLHPLEDCRGIQALIDGGWDVDSVASRLGKSATWVVRRARLNKLIPAFQKMAQDPASALSRAPTGVLERLASFTTECQSGLVKDFKDQWRRRCFDQATESLKEFDDEITSDLLMDLRGVPWKLDDETLYPEAGGCSSCPHRSSQQPMLFDDVNGSTKGADQCLNRACFEVKRIRAVSVKVDEKRAEHKNLVLLHGSGPRPRDEAFKTLGKIGREWDYQRCKKSDPSARPALMVSGSQAGQLKWVKRHGSAASASAKKPAKKQPPTPKQQAAQLKLRRAAYVRDKMLSRLDDIERGKIAVRDDQYIADPIPMLLALFHSHEIDIAKAPRPLDPWAWAKRFADMPTTDQCDTIVRLLCIGLANDMPHVGKFATPKIVKEFAAYAAKVCVMMHWDLAAIEAEAVEKIPEPKTTKKAAKRKTSKSRRKGAK